jgi:hypothetical protein
VLGRARLGDRDRDLPRPAGRVVLPSFLLQHGCSPMIAGRPSYSAVPFYTVYRAAVHPGRRRR